MSDGRTDTVSAYNSDNQLIKRAVVDEIALVLYTLHPGQLLLEQFAKMLLSSLNQFSVVLSHVNLPVDNRCI